MATDSTHTLSDSSTPTKYTTPVCTMTHHCFTAYLLSLS